MREPHPRERILDAALDLLAERGPAGPSLRALGARAGLHNSSLFHHFPGKDAILDGVAERVIGAAAARLLPLRADDPPRLESLAGALGDLAERWSERPAEAAHLLRLLATAGAPTRQRVTDEVLTPLAEWIARARAAGAVGAVRPGPATLRILGAVLLESAWPAPGATGLPPARRARRRELARWVGAVLAPG
jgi:AcrR family transcriptional regulator